MPTNDIAHASTEILESEVQNRYLSRYLKDQRHMPYLGVVHNLGEP
jgi:hypothetical protein